MPKESEWEEVVHQEEMGRVANRLKKEEKLKQINAEKELYAKKILQIERSKTWSYTRKVNKLRKKLYTLFGKRSSFDEIQNQRYLEAELEKTKEELYELKRRYEEIFLNNERLNEYEIEQFIQDVRKRGRIVDYLEHLLHEKSQLTKNYNHALRYIARLFMREGIEYRHFIYEKILSSLSVDEIPEFMLREGLLEPEENQLSLKNVPSFRASLSMRIRQKQFMKQLPEYMLEDKIDAYYLADRLQIRRPQVYVKRFCIEDVQIFDHSVIKPYDGAGARGVYLIYSEHDMIDLYRSRKLSSRDELIKSMKKDLETCLVPRDQWFAEELIQDPNEVNQQAKDLKFYCFYGKVGLILEISRYPERRHCWWTRDGKRIRTGKYDDEIFIGDGVTENEIKMIEEVSAKIPAPFLRIDFLRSENELIFGEFTAKPGNYDEFNDEIDQLLGDYYLEAEARLTKDLFLGKSFDEFKEFYKLIGYEEELIQNP